MGNRTNEALSIGIVSAALIAAFLLSTPSMAAAGREDRGRPSFAEGIISMVNKRLCDRQHALAGRLPVQLIHPSKCNTQPEPDPDPTVTITANPQTIDEGESATLSWTSTNATECSASEGWSGTKTTSGSQSVSPSVTTTYHLDCEGPGGSDEDEVTVTVIPTEEPEDPTVEITANPMNIIEGGSSTLTWNSDNADSCTASGGWTGDKTVDGSQSVSPTATTTYTIECENETGSASDSVTVGVSADEPDMGTLIVRKLVIRDDGDTSATSTFSFKVNNGATTTFEADGENSMSVVAGTYTVVETIESEFTTSYNNCSSVAISDGETEICTITNNDVDDAEDPTVSITASRMTVTEGSTSSATTTLTWESSNATECTASNGWTGTKAVDGSETVAPTATTTYAITCTGEGGEANDSVTVNFVPEDEEPAPSGNLLITEVHYDLATSSEGVESANEWVELLNGTDQVLNLEGYTISDSAGSDTVPAGVTLQPGQFLVITASSTTASFYDIPGSAVILVLPNNIGSNGLGNAADLVFIENDEGAAVDEVSWGTNTNAFSPSVRPGTTADDFPGQSIGRINNTVDTGTAADWESKSEPTPGE